MTPAYAASLVFSLMMRNNVNSIEVSHPIAGPKFKIAEIWLDGDILHFSLSQKANHVPEVGTVTGDSLAEYYDRKDRAGESTGD